MQSIKYSFVSVSNQLLESCVFKRFEVANIAKAVNLYILAP